MREKIGHRGRGVGWGPLLQKTSSSDSKATATNQMHCNDLGASVVVFGSIPKSSFLTRQSSL